MERMHSPDVRRAAVVQAIGNWRIVGVAVRLIEDRLDAVEFLEQRRFHETAEIEVERATRCVAHRPFHPLDQRSIESDRQCAFPWSGLGSHILHVITGGT